MKKINIKLLARKIFKIFAWAFLVIATFFIILAIARIPHYLNTQKTLEQVAKIHSTRLQINDVTGEFLPPDPGMEADKTLQGIDKNNNGIRDDVELAIFKEYPNSAKTRAVLLQYALIMQIETSQPFLNYEIVTKIINEESRADTCLSDTLVPRISPESSRNDVDMEKIEKIINFIEEKQINNNIRKEAHNSFYKYIGTQGKFTESLKGYLNTKDYSCDIDLSKLSN